MWLKIQYAWKALQLLVNKKKLIGNHQYIWRSTVRNMCDVCDSLVRHRQETFSMRFEWNCVLEKSTCLDSLVQISVQKKIQKKSEQMRNDKKYPAMLNQQHTTMSVLMFCEPLKCAIFVNRWLNAWYYTSYTKVCGYGHCFRNSTMNFI